MGGNFHGRRDDRKKRRMPCRLSVGEAQHNGLVLDLSRSGLFIQTSSRARPGEKVEVEISDEEGRDLTLQVEVVRRKAVPPRLLSVAHGGIGVRILEAPDAYRDFLRELGVPDDAPCPSRSRKRFGLVLRQTPGSRSKRVELEADDEESAVRIALDAAGEGWTVQQVGELD